MNRDQLEDIYPLSPMQHGMLFDTLYWADTGIYTQHPTLQLTGSLHLDALKQAWRQVIARHAALRTLFVWEKRDQPLQIVRRQVDLPWQQYDWRAIPPDQHQAQLAQLLAAEQEKPFNLKQAPLLRLILVQRSDTSHYLVILFHHIILDGWSVGGPILSQLFTVYDTAVTGRPTPLPSAPPYGDYISWLQAQDPAPLESFWRTYLAGFTTPTRLGIEQPTTETTAVAAPFAHVEAILPDALTANLTAWAKQQRLTLNTLFQCTWALLLMQFSGQSDIVFGTAVSGRPAQLAGVTDMVGLFINTLPLRLQAEAHTTLLDLLQQLQKTLLRLQSVSHSPLVDVQRWSEVPPGVPLFNSLVVYENVPAQFGHTATDLTVEAVTLPNHSRALPYPLTLTCFPDQQMWLQLSYDPARYAPADMERLLRHFQHLLHTIPTTADQPLHQRPLLTPAEHQQIVRQWNDTGHAPLPTTTLHQLFEQQVSHTPHTTAVEAGQDHLTYHQLNNRANQLAHHLRQHGIGPGHIVALWLERSPTALTALLAILKSGAAYLPIDPTLPAARQQFILADAAVSLILTHSQMALAVPPGTYPTLYLDRAAEAIAQQPTTNLPADLAAPTDLIYVLYTSGSTGQPKGVAVPHQTLVNLIQWQHGRYQGGRTAQFTTLGFDVSCQEIFTALCTGGTLVIMPDELRQDPEQWLSFLVQARIERLFLPFVALQQLAEIVAFTDELPIHLRQVITAGEQLQTTPAIQRLFTRLPTTRLWNHYGPTESHVVTSHALPANPAVWTALPPIGTPIAHTQLYILDAHLRPVPPGVPGELHIGGIPVARGYLERPRQTAVRFIPDPFSPQASARLYRTGDMARYHPDGTIAFLGRADFQIKLRGYRIELGEVETCLTHHPAVAQAVVTADKAHQRLVAYVRLAEDTPTDTLRQWLAQQLPHYMIPAAWAVVEQFPQTPSGKINRLRLPSPEGGLPHTPFVPPETADEKTIAAIWETVLGVNQVGLHHNFFDLGGHSLLAIQIISRMCQQLTWPVPLRALFETPTIADIIATYAPAADLAAVEEVLAALEGASEATLAELEALLEDENGEGIG